MNSLKLFTKFTNHHQSIVRHASFIKSIKNFIKVEKYQPPYNHIVQIGDPVLRVVSDEIPEDVIKSKEVKTLLNQMESVRQSYSLVGISSPQIGINLRVFFVCFDKDAMKKFTPEQVKAKEMSLMPLTVFINPQIKVLDHRKVTFEESCASFMGYAADVSRSHSIEVTAFDEKGVKTTASYSGWNARIIQHENDHLNGVMFTDIMDRKTLRCANWEMVNRKMGKIEIPFYPKSILD